MAKPTKLTLDLGAQFDYIQKTIINRLFSKLEEIRQYHVTGGKSGSGFTNENTPATFNEDIAQQYAIIDTTYPNQIKNYITLLEASRYIPDNEYSSRVELPIQAETIIKSMNNYLEYVNIINDLIDINANDGSYCGVHNGAVGCSSDCSTDGCYGDGWNSIDHVCRTDGANYGTYMGGYSYDGCCGYATGDSNCSDGCYSNQGCMCVRD